MKGSDSSESGTQLTTAMDQITAIRQEIIAIDKENVKYANQFRELTIFNQTIGDEIANFDVRIYEYENRIRQRTIEINAIKKQTFPIQVSIDNLRQDLLQNLEFRMAVKNLIKMEQKCIDLEQRINTFKTIISDNYDPTKCESLLNDKIQILKESNSDLETQIYIMEMLLNKKNSNSDQDQKTITFEIKNRKKQIKSLDKQIREYEIKRNSVSQMSNNEQIQHVEEKDTAIDLFGQISEDSESLVPESESMPSCIIYTRNHSNDSSETNEIGDDEMDDIEKLQNEEENLLKLLRLEECEKLKKTEEKFLIQVLFEDDEESLKKKNKRSLELKEKDDEEEFLIFAKLEEHEEEIKRKEEKKLRKAILEENEDEMEKMKSDEDDKDNEEDFLKEKLIEEIETIKDEEKQFIRQIRKQKKNSNHKNKRSKYSLSVKLEITEFPEISFPPDKIVLSDEDMFSETEIGIRDGITNDEIKQKENLLNKKSKEYQLKKQLRDKLQNKMNSPQFNSNSNQQSSQFSNNFSNRQQNNSVRYSNESTLPNPKYSNDFNDWNISFNTPRSKTLNEPTTHSNSLSNQNQSLNGLPSNNSNSLSNQNQSLNGLPSNNSKTFNQNQSLNDSFDNDLYFLFSSQNDVDNKSEIGVQTKKNGKSIDSLIERLEKKRQNTIEINQLQEELEIFDKEIEEATQKLAEVDEKNRNYDNQIKEAKRKHDESMTNNLGDTNQYKSRNLYSEMSFDSSFESDSGQQRNPRMMAEYHQKRLELNRILIRTREYEKKLEQLQRRRGNIEKEIYDLDHREKPEVVRLTVDVSHQKAKSIDINNQLQKSQQELLEKRQMLEDLRQSELRNQYFDLLVQKSKIGRRILKWKMFLSDCDETIQYLESFSATNYERRQSLSTTLQKIEREQFLKNEQVEELKSYSNLLADLIKAYSDIMKNY